MKKNPNVYDDKFKEIISRKNILSWVVKLTIPALKDVDIDDIRESLPTDPEGNTVIQLNTVLGGSRGSRVTADTLFGITFRLPSGSFPVLIGIEGQNDPSPGYDLEARMQYYVARLFSSQKTRGGRYDTLRPAYFIWIMPDARKKDKGTVWTLKHHWAQVGSRARREFDSRMNIIVVNLGNDDNDQGILGFLGPLFTWTGSEGTEERLAAYRERYKLKPEDITLEEVNSMCGIFADSKVRYTREGREIGREEAQIEIIANMITELSLTFEEAAAIAKIPDDRMDHVRSEVDKILNNTPS